MTITVKIQFCGAWGFDIHFDRAKQLLEAKYPGAIKVVRMRDGVSTGNFKITNEDDRSVLHSRGKHGADMLKTKRERESLFEKIDNIFASKGEKVPEPNEGKLAEIEKEIGGCLLM